MGHDRQKDHQIGEIHKRGEKEDHKRSFIEASEGISKEMAKCLHTRAERPNKTEPSSAATRRCKFKSAKICPKKHDPHLDEQMPKKRGRKKGSKNHKNLIDEAESSFTSKLAVSRGNSKVKTTQELIASLQNKNSSSVLNSITVKPKEDLMEKAAKLTERLERNEKVIESGSVINDKSLLAQSLLIKKEEEEIDVVDAEDDMKTEVKKEKSETETEKVNVINSLSVEEILAQLPPIDKSVLLEEEDEERCTCVLNETKPDFSIEDDCDVSIQNRFKFIEDHDCPAKLCLTNKYHLDCVTEESVHRLHTSDIPNVNGNHSIGPPKPGPVMLENGLYANIVPNVNTERIPKDVKYFSSETFSRYSFSETEVDNVVVKSEVMERTGDDATYNSDNSYREWHEMVETPSFNGEILKILPYVIID
ncbi:hypothetical protein NQ317_005794 [Molorchus minor]|uniref:Uncharacterized protein n=1 Tax=Molorchus minor TaxID=1323400 RepID=A0ABQ9JFB6_9CUCU|nr:hypothetical protein NQ317_005794 [Molorchus minor]